MNIRTATVIRILIVVLLVACIGVGGVFLTNRVADDQKQNYFNQRKIQVTTAAAALDYRDVQALKANASDTDNPAFQRIRSELMRIKASDAHIRFVYLMRPQGSGSDKLVFLADAEDPNSKDYSWPGQVYKETKKNQMAPFGSVKNPATMIEDPVKDEWGTWLSASAFIVDHDGHAVALLGTDVDVERALSSVNQTKHFGIILDLLACALLLLLGLQWVLWRYNRDKRLELRTEMESSIIRLNDELVKADQMKSEFIQMASHELRGPVNAVNIAVNTMDRSLTPKLSDDELSLVKVAKNGTRRLVDLIDNLLDLTRIEADDMVLRPQEYDPRTAVVRTAELFEPVAAEKGLDLQLSVPEGELETLVDPNALLRVLENLVANAIKFTEEGAVEIRLEKKESRLAFSVKDTGPGIPLDFQPDAFKKFKRYHGSSATPERGAGMGLALCKALVEKMGGEISFETGPGGTTFFFDIPLTVARTGGSSSNETD